MNIAQWTDILLDIKTAIDANLHMDYESHLKRLEEIGLDVSIDKEVTNLHKPVSKDVLAEWDTNINELETEEDYDNLDSTGGRSDDDEEYDLGGEG
mgnify:CR=1 FL=1